MFWKKKYLLAKIESVYGTDPVPTATDAILTTNLNINPYEGNRVSRNLDRAYMGAQEEVNTGPMVSIDFEVEFAGAGAAGDVPGYGTLLRACGFAETINASTDVQYDLVSEGFESVALYYWLDGQLHKVTGCRGTVSLNMQREELPRLRFNIQGNYNSPISAVTVNPDVSAFVDPLAVLNVNTSLTFFGQAVLTEQVTLDLANQIVPRFLINGDRILITDRAPTANLVFEAPSLSTYDYFAQMESHAGVNTGALQVIHGTTPGNIVQVDCPAIQIASLQPQDSDGIVAYNTNGSILPVTGNDEWKITVK